ncbi:MAG: 16S rRNA (cytosine(1402)-N(4))-methyltransferase RsmH [Myxococcales bacterium FL481]|nr:MAG: 16S rRNA (cytosine(1402)-N(4))-methyltransferase RsmH [Myxococcales bacterium FL481]
MVNSQGNEQKFDRRDSRWQPRKAVANFHTSVLADEVCEALVPALSPSSEGTLVDATCGGGGHIAALAQAGACLREVLAFDRDADALAHAAKRLGDLNCPLRMFHAPFSTLASRLDELVVGGERERSEVSAIIADLGVSSHQLDEMPRGFSFRGDAPLDMRMDPSRGAPLSERLAELDVKALAGVLRRYGEEPDASRIAAAIVQAGPRRTAELAAVVEAAMSAPQRRRLGRRIHPATRTFQALRIWLNDELGELERLLDSAPDLLVVGGRLGVITFHSLEDRCVKHRFRALTRRPEAALRMPVPEAELMPLRFAIPKGWANGRVATPAETAANPRARSARLRVLERRAP